jgi:hypothetical protein
MSGGGAFYYQSLRTRGMCKVVLIIRGSNEAMGEDH